MKRIFFAILAVLLFAVVDLPAQNAVTGAMMLRSTNVIKTKKKLNEAPIKKGYQSEFSIAYSFFDYGKDAGSMFNFNYIGGYRFNHYVYLGVGTGVDLSTYNNGNPVICWNKNHGFFERYEMRDTPKGDYVQSYTALPLQRMAVPLYLHLRIYFMKTKFAPFLALSGGVRISTPKILEVYNASDYGYVGKQLSTYRYGTFTGMVEAMPGINYQHSKRFGVNFQIGIAARSYRDIEYIRECADIQDLVQRDWLMANLMMRIGLVF